VAIVPELGGKKVFVVEDGKAFERAVETGMRTDQAVEIVRGLAAGDRVVVSGLERVTDGAAVEARAAE
jgi:membrane fusion protein (multidrug efflux system)